MTDIFEKIKMILSIDDLEFYRRSYGLSQRAMDRKLGFSEGSVCRWESGKRKISQKSLAKINRVLFGERKRSIWQRIKDWIF